VAFQKFLTEQNNLKAVRVIANQNVVQAEAAARANIAKASGESEAIKIITGQLRSSPEYLQWQAINRWNGQLPYAIGGSGFPITCTARSESIKVVTIITSNRAYHACPIFWQVDSFPWLEL
jgi:regulator of protease activity HflC (stomatin/prohibitin superfamily)